MARPLILASSSTYRRGLLEKLQLPFTCHTPHINEEALPGEAAQALAQRLAEEKAHAIANSHPEALIIGSDQAAECRGRILGKPGTRERAQEQLQFCSGHPVHFYTGICLLDAHSGKQRSAVEIFTVYFRQLDESQIRRYVELEKPLNCAGSFKAEGLGIALFEKMEGSDINSLIGLPLIRLIDFLREFGVDPLAD
ncbi:Maf family protein [Microbulbifer thermotolerans]|uniref:7-methyl-GTP pyrophosphatase n=1 Tax=Microbulbifer thermotolerans TaxID=252514 RepID=A0A143HLT9_MICTH|nr:nucleoside triphosphate pyrophosphatase [Microbulbifer thermotolerans]AMX02491.1 septum formation inhibitor Maf [Microbulbifer thermotolerans]MCX2779344.1 Maf family nucleotide pyrophosphatase [Microbulbifer thermotolerans]MCX2795037.1 Maf family nucleotide pyrophosphatase [Microbulbifer thermotolerans]MCX2800605.1 Maf family nucleotide pyrophosphatase [Microbulbifer thermotolerans]MCX2805754.1 Maf family nucleotide pyrophosphatase [Microbulbifer thermotolerans]